MNNKVDFNYCLTSSGTDTSGKLAKCWHHYRKHIILASILLGITALIILIACVAHHVSSKNYF